MQDECLALAVAWGSFVLASGAAAWLLLGVVTLSERRASFVSAVTHELRTPLTTFRLYAEMLATGRVATEEKRKQYLETLSLEAARLGGRRLAQHLDDAPALVGGDLQLALQDPVRPGQAHIVGLGKFAIHRMRRPALEWGRGDDVVQLVAEGRQAAFGT